MTDIRLDPLSASQADFIVFDSFWPGAFLGPEFTVIESGIFEHDPGAMVVQSSIEKVVSRHQALRVSFERAGSGLQAVIREDVVPETITALTLDSGDNRIEALNAQLSECLIPLSGASLHRWIYEPLDNGRAFLGAAFHHMIIDARSAWAVLHEVAANAFEQELRKAPKLDEYCARQSERLLDPTRSAKRNNFWAECYSWEPDFDVPTESVAQAGTAICKTVRIDLPTRLTRHETDGGGLMSFATYCAAAMLAKQAMMLPYASPDSSLTTASVGSLREASVAQPIGPAFRIHPVVIERTLGHHSLAEFGQLVQRRWLTSWQEADAPMHRIIQSRATPRSDRVSSSTNGCPMLFQVSPPVPQLEGSSGRFMATPRLVAPKRRTWGIEAMISPAERRREFVLSYDPLLFSEASMRSLADIFTDALEDVLYNSSESVQATIERLATKFSVSSPEIEMS